jgi:hypothetical protein
MQEVQFGGPAAQFHEGVMRREVVVGRKSGNMPWERGADDNK